MAMAQRPRTHDTKCPDGFTCYGWRRVNRGGYVRFAHGRHYHDDLIPLEGQWVYVILADMWGLNVEVWTGKPWAGESLLCESEQDRARATPTPMPLPRPHAWPDPATPGWPFNAEVSASI